jgi:hypothetical protein
MQLSDFARAAPAQNRPKLSGHRMKCVSPVLIAIFNCVKYELFCESRAPHETVICPDTTLYQPMSQYA